jgi:hypothetical protein
MKDLAALDEFRQRDRRILEMYGSFGDGGNGVFRLLCQRTGTYLHCLASNGDGWDHVSVSVAHRIPNWLEMDFAKRMFFADDETAMQLHVPSSDHVNHHPFCLHLWRPNDGREIPRPPAEFVGPVVVA